MTLKELYQLAKAKGHENMPIVVLHYCGDCWYDLEETVDINNITFAGNSIVIEFE